ncbi:single-strand binding protein [Alkalispirochaeta americana]|uniref:Single-stranded DNA-binding protein n=1 Tax=Alkalispirochaeta americana TaxID=159291 RepID=A0A1N6PSE2_9SPIO|nr:single-stranded DNA-binding protein [Alkalispirochaeta americana]SIQ07139.1 single-strand binding protein [Alkalispirochaeta americana]
MADINHVVLVGRLVRDAQLKYTGGGLAICEFSLAINNRRKQGDQWVDEPSFFDVTLFGRQGEAIQRYLTQGKQIGVDGQLRQDRWQTPEGQNRSKVVVIANNVMLLGGAGAGAGGGSGEGGGFGSSRSDREGSGGSGAPRGGGGPGGDDGFGSDDFPDNIPF